MPVTWDVEAEFRERSLIVIHARLEAKSWASNYEGDKLVSMRHQDLIGGRSWSLYPEAYLDLLPGAEFSSKLLLFIDAIVEIGAPRKQLPPGARGLADPP